MKHASAWSVTAANSMTDSPTSPKGEGTVDGRRFGISSPTDTQFSISRSANSKGDRGFGTSPASGERELKSRKLGPLRG